MQQIVTSLSVCIVISDYLLQMDETTTSSAQDLRISVPASCQQQQQQNPTVTYQSPPVIEPLTVVSPPVSAAPPPPPFSLGLIAVGPHPSFGVVPPAPTSDSASAGGSTALNIPMIRQSESGASGGPTRRRVSDKTALPLSTGNVLFTLRQNSTSFAVVLLSVQ